jgi:hypothetical protein
MDRRHRQAESPWGWPLPGALWLLAALAAGCSAHAEPADPTSGDAASSGGTVGVVGSSGPRKGTGTVGLHLLIGPGVSLTMCQWSISNVMNFYGGYVDLGDAQATGNISFVTGGILAGPGYVLSIRGTDTNGDPCSGSSSPFTVSAAGTSSVSIQVTCVVPTDVVIPADVGTQVVCRERCGGRVRRARGPAALPPARRYSVPDGSASTR